MRIRRTGRAGAEASPGRQAGRAALRGTAGGRRGAAGGQPSRAVATGAGRDRRGALIAVASRIWAASGRSAWRGGRTALVEWYTTGDEPVQDQMTVSGTPCWHCTASVSEPGP